MDKGITRLSKNPDAPLGPLDGLIDAIADRVVQKIQENPIEITNHVHDPSGIAWMTMREASAKLGIEYSKVAAAVRKGELPCHIILGRKRLNPQELDEWAMEEGKD